MLQNLAQVASFLGGRHSLQHQRPSFRWGKPTEFLDLAAIEARYGPHGPAAPTGNPDLTARAVTELLDGVAPAHPDGGGPTRLTDTAVDGHMRVR